MRLEVNLRMLFATVQQPELSKSSLILAGGRGRAATRASDEEKQASDRGNGQGKFCVCLPTRNPYLNPTRTSQCKPFPNHLSAHCSADMCGD